MAQQRDLTPDGRNEMHRSSSNARRDGARRSVNRQSARFANGLPEISGTPEARTARNGAQRRQVDPNRAQRAREVRDPNRQNQRMRPEGTRQSPSAQRRAEAERRYRAQPRASQSVRDERERREREVRARQGAARSYPAANRANQVRRNGRSVPAAAQDYSRYGYVAQSKAKKKNPAPVIVLIVAVIAAIALFVAFGLPALTGSQNSKTTSSSNNKTVVDAGQATDASTNNAANATSAVNSEAAEAAIVLTLSGDYDTYVLKGESYVEPGAHAVENRASDISSSIKIEGSVDTSKAGDYSVTYTATSSTGLKLSRTRTVHVVDTMDTATQVPVLMYHYVYTAADPPEDINANYLLDTDFEAQLQYLTSNNYYYPSYAELRAFIDGTHSLPAKSVILTFDDGEAGFLTYGVPLLEKYKVPGTSFLIGCDNIAPCLANASPYVTYQSHSYDMHQAGGTVGHGGIISAMTQAEILADLQHNIQLLGSSDAFAYPFGDTTEEGQAAVKEAGILCAFTTDYDYVEVGDDPTLLSRIRVLGGYDLDSYVASLG